MYPPGRAWNPERGRSASIRSSGAARSREPRAVRPGATSTTRNPSGRTPPNIASFDGLSVAVRSLLQQDPMSGFPALPAARGGRSVELDWTDLTMPLGGVELLSVQRQPAWEPAVAPVKAKKRDPRAGPLSALPLGCQTCGMTRRSAAQVPSRNARNAENSAGWRKRGGSRGGPCF